jgi:hypothetical protein
VLILHLKRFTFDQHGPRKVSRPIRFGETLRIHRSHLASGCVGAKGKGNPAYQLVAGARHEGAGPGMEGGGRVFRAAAHELRTLMHIVHTNVVHTIS